ncbi:MAG TPA: cell division protein FtsL [Vicinamibacterales bacterium]|jgi:cell division protein FtsL|nr:cell division protein FtsL [Vicinamibacterales bacterium]
MSSVDFEYAIKQDVRNNPIVREIDEARQRQMRRTLAIGALLVAVMLFSAWQNAALVQHGYKLQRLQQEIEAEKVVNRRLRLEIAALRSPQRIEDLAKQMKLVPPTQAEAIVIERVTPPAPPDKSVVAAR